MSKKNIIPIFVPHEGCPNDCVFCNQRKITGISTTLTEADIDTTIETYLDYFKNDNEVEVALYGGSFTAIEQSAQEWILKQINKYIDKNVVHSIRLSTRPDAIDENRLNLLKKYNVSTIELGVQSLNQEVLNKSKRGHTVESVYNSSELIKSYGFTLGLQQMLGLYGDDFEKSYFTAKEFVKIAPDFVRIYPTLIIKETELEKLYLANLYKPLSVDETVKWLKKIVPIYNENNIKIIRIGLQTTDNIKLGADVVAGPFHPAIRQLVESELLIDKLVQVLKEYELTELTIKASGRNISNISGNKGSGKSRLLKELNLNKIKLVIDNTLDDILIDINNLEYNLKVVNRCY